MEIKGLKHIIGYKTTQHPMIMYYLNNNGSRWVIMAPVTNKRLQMTFTTKSGIEVKRRVKYFEALGNFGLCAINWNGKLIKVFPDTLLEG